MLLPMILKKAQHMLYRFFPSWSKGLHRKKRKGLATRWPGLECQRTQDAIFWEKFLRGTREGTFWEVGAGDGVTGSQTLCLETEKNWKGALWEPCEGPRETASKHRKGSVIGWHTDPVRALQTKSPNPDLLAVHRPDEFLWVWNVLSAGKITPRWVIVENPDAEVRWASKLLECGYRLVWFFQDDEYFERRSR